MVLDFKEKQAVRIAIAGAQTLTAEEKADFTVAAMREPGLLEHLHPYVRLANFGDHLLALFDSAVSKGENVLSAKGSHEGTFEVMEALSPTGPAGGVFKVLGIDGPWADNFLVLRHGGDPAMLEMRHRFHKDCIEWHQVIREREAVLALQGAGWPYLPRMLLAGSLQLFPQAPAGCLSGAPAVLTELAGRPLVADRQVPVLPPQKLIALASCGLTAVCELRERGIWHNDLCPRNITVQAPDSEGSPTAYTFVDLGYSSSPNLDSPSLRDELDASKGEMPSSLSPITDLMYGSVQALAEEELRPSSDLQCLAFTLIKLSGAVLPWDAAARAGHQREALQMRLNLIKDEPAGARSLLGCLHPIIGHFVSWVLDQAEEAFLDPSSQSSWRTRLQEAAANSCSGTCLKSKPLPMLARCS
ncbi:hypothetical protein COCSUDRAFT_61268 [Coccomyxa subellipsoidea C-169]|uniref:Protein kinase domain-containing protein n=1 Tax=Coccomyxa subellipsoidea (strain C-169) TaxID=574566 RepID=I0Z300_COCSC|nr:hypothetical protein COCSUDRAFT_61268 [Coccomyxa subellipsoidea C-169]EIE25019.1 hypothetical protein COCSUDRAFT_61268 [Coccomyxa subellipsoidea C-169]|eukprot:XP_005649563.1 hypothetical protein COCSUDRAFT_61268 [Coccomyxa subellipsoidea C-169]